MLKLGCISTGSYASTLVTAVSLVLLVAVPVLLIYLYEMRQLDRADYHPDDEEAITDLRELDEQFDKDGDGIVDYQEFARWFGAGPPPPGAGDAAFSSPPAPWAWAAASAAAVGRCQVEALVTVL